MQERRSAAVTIIAGKDVAAEYMSLVAITIVVPSACDRRHQANIRTTTYVKTDQPGM